MAVFSKSTCSQYWQKPVLSWLCSDLVYCLYCNYWKGAICYFVWQASSVVLCMFCSGATFLTMIIYIIKQH
uniref:Uncharacterized protein n=1 Tax=Anguilla anguilla TaxID=7936 RepID=A0A0E9RJA5_ANGAN